MNVIAGMAAGFTPVALCEIDEFPRHVLRYYHPGVPLYDDLKTLTGDRLRADGIGHIDLLTGGIPCQPTSSAGQRLGSADERWLWPDALRLVGELAPTWLCFENPPSLLTIGTPAGSEFERITATLAEMGYQIGWSVYGAADVGAPHQRDRVFIIGHFQGSALADPQGTGQQTRGGTIGGTVAARQPGPLHGRGVVARGVGHRWREGRTEPEGQQGRPDVAERRNPVADAGDAGQHDPLRPRGPRPGGIHQGVVADPEQLQGRQRRDADVLRRRTTPAQLVGLGSRRTVGPVGNADSQRWDGRSRSSGESRWPESESSDSGVGLADPNSQLPGHGHAGEKRLQQDGTGTDEGSGHALPDTDDRGAQPGVDGDVARAASGLSRATDLVVRPRWPAGKGPYQHPFEPPRLASGVPHRAAQIKALGNGCLPQQLYLILKPIADQLRQEWSTQP